MPAYLNTLPLVSLGDVIDRRSGSQILHSEHAVRWSGNRSIESRAQRDADGVARVDGIEDAIVPDFRSGKISAGLAPIVFQNRIANRGGLLFGQLLTAARELPQFHIGQDAGGLLGTHDRDLGLRPGKHEARVEGST